MQTDAVTDLADRIIRRYCTSKDRPLRVLDFGCGDGTLVRNLAAIGYDAYGCDLKSRWLEGAGDPSRLKVITHQPYRLPYAADSFDVVFSTSVFEHVRDKNAGLNEIYRVLRPGGYAMHLFPSKWYLPQEPHIRVPLLNFWQPYCPASWIAFWAWLGVRSRTQRELPWREVMERNIKYCREGLSYWSLRKYRNVSLHVFGDFSSPMDWFVGVAPGGSAHLLRRLFPPAVAGWLMGQFRTRLIVQRKLSGYVSTEHKNRP